MNTKHISLAILAMVALLAGCAKSPIEGPRERNLANLELSYVGATETKAAIDGTNFPTDGKIGLFLFKDDQASQPYGESGYENVEYSYNSTKGKWTASPSIKVGSETGYLFGYYPYSSTAANVKTIPVSSSLDGDDVMYATSQTVTDKTASGASIMMNHALARVAIKVINKGYTGDAKLTSIMFSGAETAESGVLNVIDGSISATKSNVTLEVPSDKQTITKEGTVYECLLVPSDVEPGKQELGLTLTIDGDPKTATLSGDNGVIITQGTQSNITITLSNSGISVQTVSVDSWNVVEVGGYKVSIAMADGVTANDIMCGAYVDGDNVIIKAYSEIGQHLKCTMPDGELCSSQSKTDNLAYTFTITDITENTTVTIGYAVSTSIAISPENAGRVEIEGVQDKNSHFEGETFKHMAIPNEEYSFAHWQDQYGNILCEDEEYTFRASSKVNVTAVFVKRCVLYVFVSPSLAGSVPAFEKLNHKGKEITLTTTPFGNSVFNGWKDKDGNILSDKSTYTFTIESDQVLIADYSVDYGTDALDGVFTVAADRGGGVSKKVRFSKGNMWYGKTSGEAQSATFNLEEDQWGFQITSTGQWDPEHISHFFWREDAVVSYQQNYGSIQASENNVLFTNTADFTVNGVSAWYTLSNDEWEYLLGDSDERNGKYKTWVSVNGKMGLVIAPDDFKGTISNSYTDSEWKTAESIYGLVFLPAAGFRNGLSGKPDIYDAATSGYYWSASIDSDNNAIGLFFVSDNVYPHDIEPRYHAQLVRLVTDATE